MWASCFWRTVECKWSGWPPFQGQGWFDELDLIPAALSSPPYTSLCVTNTMCKKLCLPSHTNLTWIWPQGPRDPTLQMAKAPQAKADSLSKSSRVCECPATADCLTLTHQALSNRQKNTTRLQQNTKASVFAGRAHKIVSHTYVHDFVFKITFIWETCDGWDT